MPSVRNVPTSLTHLNRPIPSVDHECSVRDAQSHYNFFSCFFLKLKIKHLLPFRLRLSFQYSFSLCNIVVRSDCLYMCIWPWLWREIFFIDLDHMHGHNRDIDRLKERNFIENKIIPTLPALPVDVSCISLYIFSIARIFPRIFFFFCFFSLAVRARRKNNKQKWN